MLFRCPKNVKNAWVDIILLPSGSLFRDPGLRGEREFPFPTIPGNTGLPFPFPKFGNEFFIPIGYIMINEN